VQHLEGRGEEVTAFCWYNSNASYGWLDALAATAPKNLGLRLGDVRDPRCVAEAVRGHATVLHLAALIAIPYSYEAPQSYVETNVLGTLHVAQACREHDVERLVHTSTSEVYGTARQVPITEEHPLVGQSPYAATKIGADAIVESFVRSHGLRATTLRPFNTYGPRQSLRAVIPTVIAQILAGRDEIRLGSVAPTRDFNYVEDTVAAFVALATADAQAVTGRTFNAGSGREIAIGDFAALAGQVLGRTVRIVTDAERQRPAASEVERLLASSDRLRAVTAWRPTVPLEEGIRRVAAWLRSSPWLARAPSYVR
jgi:UDP-glucose 4-epimerase